MGVGDMLDEIFRIYRQNFRTLFGIGLIALMPSALLQVLLSLATGTQPGEPGVSTTLIVALISSALGWAGYAATTVAISDIILGRSPTVEGSFRRILSYVIPMIGLFFAMMLAAILMFVTIIGIPFAIHFLVAWALAPMVMLIERAGIRRSFGRSRDLVRGTWWRVFGILFLASLLYGIILGILSIPSGIFTLMAIGPGSEGVASSLFGAIRVLLGGAAQAVTAPIGYAIGTVLYYDLRIRKEGFDLTVLAQEMDHPRQPDVP